MGWSNDNNTADDGSNESFEATISILLIKKEFVAGFVVADLCVVDASNETDY